ncbi:hypothetical protein RJ640_013095 [Escallonia rubra]|uniref:Uncharacterized protein n=1 Tax=Escallonia rubra TaxID=112253 RepID=A0AA88R3Y7_9ASTE|nr:hypothetical protein RJ640_013095 [Escallonia rubra]
MRDDVQMSDASLQSCFQLVIDYELFDIDHKDEVGAKNHEEWDLGLNTYSNGSDKMHIIDNGVVPFEYNEGETRDGEQSGECQECSEETIMGKVFDEQDEAYEFYN